MPSNENTLKVIFTFSSMAMAAYIIFSRLYFRSAGLSKSKIGLLFSIPGFILVFSQPIWSTITDYLGSARKIFQIMICGSSLFLLIYYIGADFFLNHFLALIALFVAFSFFYTGRGPTRNSMTLTYLDEMDEDNNGFGGVRLWLSIGWAVSAVILGWFFLSHSFELLFPITAGFFILTAVLIFDLPPIEKATIQRVNIFQDPQARRLLKNKEVLIFLLAVFILGVGTLASNTFLPIYLNEVLEFSTFSLGLFYALGAIAEVPLFHYGERIIDKIGIKWFLIAGFAVQSVIWILFAVITTPIFAFVIWIVRGIGYSFIYLGSVLYLDWSSPEEARTVGQSMYITTFFGIAAIVGRISGGYISQIFGLSFLYLFSGILGFIGTGILLLRRKY